MSLTAISLAVAAGFCWGALVIAPVTRNVSKAWLAAFVGYSLLIGAIGWLIRLADPVLADQVGGFLGLGLVLSTPLAIPARNGAGQGNGAARNGA